MAFVARTFLSFYGFFILQGKVSLLKRSLIPYREIQNSSYASVVWQTWESLAMTKATAGTTACKKDEFTMINLRFS